MAPGRIALLRAHAPDAARIVDKMPPNFLYLGFIATILAGTRIIHCRRHPLDTCLWLFFPYFRAGQPYAYSLERLGFYCREYRRRMAHWRAVLPKAMLELDYGALVDDRERESRRLIEFCGLPWGPRCRAFHETERAARTAEPVAGATAGLPPLGGARWAPIPGAPPAAQGRARPIGDDGGNAPWRRRSKRAWPGRNRFF